MGKPWAWFEQQPFQGKIFVIERYFVYLKWNVYFSLLLTMFSRIFSKGFNATKKINRDLESILHKTIFLFYKSAM